MLIMNAIRLVHVISLKLRLPHRANRSKVNNSNSSVDLPNMVNRVLIHIIILLLTSVLDLSDLSQGLVTLVCHRILDRLAGMVALHRVLDFLNIMDNYFNSKCRVVLRVNSSLLRAQSLHKQVQLQVRCQTRIKGRRLHKNHQNFKQILYQNRQARQLHLHHPLLLQRDLSR